MIDRTEATYGIEPDWLVADTAYSSAPNLHFLVVQKGIEPHVLVIDKSWREDGTFSRGDFNYDDGRDCYVCPAGKILPRSCRRNAPRGDVLISYFSRAADCCSFPLKARSRAKSPSRKITRHIHEAARDVARAIANTAAYEKTRRDRKKVEMLFAHLQRILRMG